MSRPSSPPDLSVVVATYEGSRWLAATLDSVLAQEGVDVQLIVCDDGSRDATPALLQRYADRAVVLRQENAGVSAARNHGARHATGRHIAFLDHDDLWQPDMAARQLTWLARHPGCGLVYADSWIVDDADRVRGRRAAFLDYREGQVHRDLLGGNFIPIETAVLPREVFETLGGFDESLHFLEDHELYLRLARRWPVCFQPEQPVARYRVHDANLSWRHEELLTEWCHVLERLLEPADGLDGEARDGGNGGHLRAGAPHASGRAGERSSVVAGGPAPAATSAGRHRVPLPGGHDPLPLTSAERAVVERELARRRGEVAWAALRRGDLQACHHWTRAAGTRCDAALRRRLVVCHAVLANLPRPLARALLRRLPRRRFYGV